MTEFALNSEVSNKIYDAVKDVLIGNGEVFHFDEISSTNSAAIFYAENGAAEGTVIISDEQKSGKGQYDRSWHSIKNSGLYISIILRPLIAVEYLTLFSFLGALSCAKMIQSLIHLKPEIKWPNDVLLNNKKISGILVESSFQNNAFDYIILGIGININHQKVDFPLDLQKSATSLFIETGKYHYQLMVLKELLKNLHDFYLHFIKKKFVFIREQWSQYSNIINKQVLIIKDGNEMKAQILKINEFGHLIALDENNNEISILSSEQIRFQ